MAVLLTHAGWNKPDGYLTITERTSAVGREAFAAIGCPDVGPTGLPIHEVFSRAVRLAAEQGHVPLSRAISDYAADVWTDGFVPPSEADLMAESSTADVEPATAPPLQSDRVEFVAPEASDIIEYSVSPRSGEKARREESQLVKRFESWLTSQGHQIERARIRPIGEANYLVTDTYDVDSKVLYEAKSSCDRATIRLAVGQLLDYLRFLPDADGAILLPDEPSYDLQSFVAACGLGLTYASADTWIEVPPPHEDA